MKGPAPANKQVHVHCGGNDQDNKLRTSDCFVMTVAENGSVVVEEAAELVRPTSWACHGSDSGRFAMAGGYSGSFHSDAWVLDSLSSTWAEAAVQLPGLKSDMAGLLLGDLLLCLGGQLDTVSCSRGELTCGAVVRCKVAQDGTGWVSCAAAGGSICVAVCVYMRSLFSVDCCG